MEFNNDVFQVLVPETVDITTATANIDTLANNKLAIVDAVTNKFLAPTAASDIPAKYFLAVRYPEGLAKSAGQYIEAKNVVAISAMANQNATKQVTNITFGNVSATADEINSGIMDTEYGIRLGFQNARIHRLIGMSPFTKSYLVSGYQFAQTTVANIPMEKKAAIMFGLMSQINAETDNLVKAYISDDSATPGTFVKMATQPADVAALYTDLDTAATAATPYQVALTLEGQLIDEYQFNDVNVHYYKDRVTTFSVYKIAGFDSTFTLQTTAAKPSVGDGYDVRMREYRAGGWNGKPGPYRASEMLGLARSGFNYHADPNAMYDIFSITYKKNNVSGWLDHTSICTTEIAVPTSQKATMNSLMGYIAGAAGIGYTSI